MKLPAYASILLALLLLPSTGYSKDSAILDMRGSWEWNPAFICHDQVEMHVTFPNPLDASWSVDLKKTTLIHESGWLPAVNWKQNEYQKKRDALGYYMTLDKKAEYKLGRYFFIVTIENGTESRVVSGSFMLHERARGMEIIEERKAAKIKQHLLNPDEYRELIESEKPAAVEPKSEGGKQPKPKSEERAPSNR